MTLDWHEWISRVGGCLQDMGASSYDERAAKSLWKQGYEPAAAAAELMTEEQEGDQ